MGGVFLRTSPSATKRPTPDARVVGAEDGFGAVGGNRVGVGDGARVPVRDVEDAIGGGRAEARDDVALWNAVAVRELVHPTLLDDRVGARSHLRHDPVTCALPAGRAGNARTERDLRAGIAICRFAIERGLGAPVATSGERESWRSRGTADSSDVEGGVEEEEDTPQRRDQCISPAKNWRWRMALMNGLRELAAQVPVEALDARDARSWTSCCRRRRCRR